MRTVVLLAGVLLTIEAQTIEVKSLYQPAALAGVWKFHLGDNPRFADADFNDSAWRDLPMPGAGHPIAAGAVWYRVRIVLPMELPAEPLSILIAPISPSYEIFVNGERVGQFGDPRAGSQWGQMVPALASFPLPPGQRHFSVAVRSWEESRASAGHLYDFTQPSWVATTAALAGKARELEFVRRWKAVGLLLMAAATCMAGLFFLMIPLWRGGTREYFWCGWVLLLGVALRMFQIISWIIGDFSLIFLFILTFLTAIPYIIAWERLFVTLFGRSLSAPVKVLIWLLLCLSAFLAVLTPLRWSAVGSFLPVYSILLLVMLASVYWDLARRGGGGAETPLMHLAVGLYVAANAVFFGLQITRWTGLATWEEGVQFQKIQASALDFRSLGLLLFAVSMAIVLNRRAGRLQGEQQRLRQELAAAAEMQVLLLPAESVRVPGFVTEAAYLPASEVGGDFYYALPDGDALVVVVGDVSGKGLRAAMLVAVAIGVLRDTAERRPAALLQALNHALAGQARGGFVTCCCARFDADGTVTIANAGHVAPYADGREVEVTGLPLALAEDGAYDEVTVRGTHFTFVSDGVVEASNGASELFGFDRTYEINTQSAAKIAEAAKAWGQNDDITVVTVQRVG